MTERDEKSPFEDDLLAEATNGLYHWNDPGMDELEEGWQEFAVGQQVEVRTEKGWFKGTIKETPSENDRAIVVRTDKKWHDNIDFYHGRGATIPVYMNTRRDIWSNIRVVQQPIPKRK